MTSQRDPNRDPVTAAFDDWVPNNTIEGSIGPTKFGVNADGTTWRRETDRRASTGIYIDGPIAGEESLIIVYAAVPKQKSKLTPAETRQIAQQLKIHGITGRLWVRGQILLSRDEDALLAFTGYHTVVRYRFARIWALANMRAMMQHTTDQQWTAGMRRAVLREKTHKFLVEEFGPYGFFEVEFKHVHPDGSVEWKKTRHSGRVCMHSGNKKHLRQSAHVQLPSAVQEVFEKYVHSDFLATRGRICIQVLLQFCGVLPSSQPKQLRHLVAAQNPQKETSEANAFVLTANNGVEIVEDRARAIDAQYDTALLKDCEAEPSCWVSMPEDLQRQQLGGEVWNEVTARIDTVTVDLTELQAGEVSADDGNGSSGEDGEVHNSGSYDTSPASGSPATSSSVQTPSWTASLVHEDGSSGGSPAQEEVWGGRVKLPGFGVDGRPAPALRRSNLSDTPAESEMCPSLASACSTVKTMATLDHNQSNQQIEDWLASNTCFVCDRLLGPDIHDCYQILVLDGTVPGHEQYPPIEGTSSETSGISAQSEMCFSLVGDGTRPFHDRDLHIEGPSPKKRRGASQYLGVTRRPCGKKWQARIGVMTQDHGYKKVNLGSFVNEVDAAKEYDRHAIKFTALDGKFRATNFPPQMPAPMPAPIIPTVPAFMTHLYVLGPNHVSFFAAGARFAALAPMPHSVQFHTWDQLTLAQQQASTDEVPPFNRWAPLARKRTWMIGYDSANTSLGLFGHLRLFLRTSIPAPTDNLNDAVNTQGLQLLAGGLQHLRLAQLFDTAQLWHDCLRVTLH